MLQLKPIIGACVMISVLASAVTTQAATYYVATNGSNSNSGTSSSPWRTVAYAVDRMVAGDTTYVKGGVYNGHVRFKKSGTQSAPIKLLNAPGQFPVIDCNNSGTQMILIQNSSGSRYPIGWITIEGFEIRECYNGIKWYNLHDSTIRRNWIHHTAHSPILGVGGKRILIDRSRLNHAIRGHGIYANGSEYTITNNVIYHNQGYGIQLNGSSGAAYDPAKFPSREFAESHNWLVANNTLAYSRTEAGMTIWGSRCNNTRVQNNVFYENANESSSLHANGIKFVSTTCTGIQIRNNLVFASGSGGTKFILGFANYSQSGNIVNTVNPKFVNAPARLPSSPNFALASGSPAVDKGLSISAAKVSYPGTTRPKLSGYDVGAYEYYGSSTQLAAPMSLQVAN